MRTGTGRDACDRRGMEMKLELVAVPVTDVDRAKAFYVDLIGFADDCDHRVQEGGSP